MIYRLGIFATVIALSLSAPATADDDLGKRFANAFVRGCLQILPNVERMNHAAKVAGWKRITGDMARMLAPRQKGTDWKMWFVDRAPAPPFFIWYAKGAELEGRPVVMCGVNNPHAPHDEVFPHIKSQLKLSSPMDESEDLGMRYRTWEIKAFDQRMFVVVNDATPMGEPGIFLSGAMQQDQ